MRPRAGENASFDLRWTTVSQIMCAFAVIRPLPGGSEEVTKIGMNPTNHLSVISPAVRRVCGCRSELGEDLLPPLVELGLRHEPFVERALEFAQPHCGGGLHGDLVLARLVARVRV